MCAIQANCFCWNDNIPFSVWIYVVLTLQYILMGKCRQTNLPMKPQTRIKNILWNRIPANAHHTDITRFPTQCVLWVSVCPRVSSLTAATAPPWQGPAPKLKMRDQVKGGVEDKAWMFPLLPSITQPSSVSPHTMHDTWPLCAVTLSALKFQLIPKRTMGFHIKLILAWNSSVNDLYGTNSTHSHILLFMSSNDSWKTYSVCLLYLLLFLFLFLLFLRGFWLQNSWKR